MSVHVREQLDVAPARLLAPALRIPVSTSGVVVGVVTLVYGIGFAWLSVARHAAFQSHAFDLGNMDQAVWNTLHGNLLRFTDMAIGHQVLTSRLAIHVEPALILMAPLYLIHSGPETLLVVQALVVASGGAAAYLLARRAGIGPQLSLVFPLAYFLYPSLQNAVLDDFHAVTLSAALLLWALYFASAGSIVGFAVMAVLATATKENIGLLVAMIGIALVVRGRRWGWPALVLGVAWFLICVELIIPHFNPAGASPYLGRYGYLGHGLGAITRTALTDPGLILHTLVSPGRLGYLGNLLTPFGYVPVLGLPVLLLAAPSLAINMLSADPRMYSGFYQYSAEVTPFVVAASIAAVAGAARIGPHSVRQVAPPVLGGLIVLASAYSTYAYGFSPIASGFVIPSAGSHQAIERSILLKIPSSAVVAAADEIEPHVSDRKTVYMLPTIQPRNGPPAQYIVLDASVPSLPVSPRILHGRAAWAMRHGYGVVAARDGVLLLRRGLRGRQLGTGIRGVGHWSAFFTFVFTLPSRVTPERASWGPLRLTGVAVHPASRLVNRSRPAISIQAVWRAAGSIPPDTAIRFYLSPVYHGTHPIFSRGWVSEGDSPAWDWLPLSRWPRGRPIVTSSLSLVPPPGQTGKVDLAIGVRATGMTRVPPTAQIRGAPKLVRVATVEVDG
ncbi:MAG TPA: DUF2079 domain-containing protein [Chloroflexota bacterium]|nr:DUF2079 domain-containing protein [Chloroflexota bacterium]